MSNELYLNDTNLQDPVQDLKDPIQDPTQVKEEVPPGFFSTLRNPLELIFEESLPASLYQYATGNTKKVQAEKALKFLQTNPQLQNTGQYKEAERIYKKFGYLLEEGEQSFDAGEILKMAKKYPSVIGAELVNMLIADPYLLLLPATMFSRLGRGIVNATRLSYSNKFKTAKRVKSLAMKDAYRDIKVGAMASTLMPFAFSTGLQLGEKGEIDANRTTAETTLGATAGLLISTALGGISALTSRTTYVNQPKINQAIINRLNKYKKIEDGIKINEDGNYQITSDLFKDIQKDLADFTPAKLKTFKAQIDTTVRELIENGRDSIKSSVVKASTFGAVGATSQFLTEEDDKVIESVKGFAVGAAAYGLIKGANKLWSKSKELSPLELDFERMTDAILVQQNKVNSNAVNFTSKLKDLLPDPSQRIRVFHNINKTKVNNNLEYSRTGRIISDSDLKGNELKAKKLIQKYFDTMYDSLTTQLDDVKFQISYRSAYAPLIFEGFASGTSKEFGEKIFGSSVKSSRFFKKRKFDNINDALEAGEKLKVGMDDPVKIIQAYTFAASKALANRNIVNYLKNKQNIIGKTKAGSPISYRAMYEFDKEIPKHFRKSNGTLDGTYREFKHPLLDRNKPYFIHQDIEKSLKMLFEAASETELMGAIFNTNLMMKRSAVGFSFFHAGALVESMFFAGVPFKVIGQFIKPRSKNQIMNMVDNPNLSLKEFTHAKTASELLDFKDVVSFARASRLEISTPEDIGYDRFYAVMQKIDNDFFKPHFGLKPMAKVEKVYKWFDRITWDRIFTQAKLYTFLTELDNLQKANPTKDIGSIYVNARRAAQFTNDAFGGQNWEAITQSITNPTYKKLAQTTFNPGSRGYLQLLFFAPDWTISNLRIIGKSLPGFNSDPVARRMYQYYFLRASLMYATVGTGLNYMFTGHSQLENKDPTRIDLGNGQVLTFSKQLMEPFHWVVDPANTGIKKIGSLPRGVIEILTNKEYLTTKWSPNLTQRDDSAIEKAMKIGGKAGEKFLPIWLLNSTRTISNALEKEGISSDLASEVALDFVLGQSGHPRYKGPRTSAYKLEGLVRSPYETLF